MIEITGLMRGGLIATKLQTKAVTEPRDMANYFTARRHAWYFFGHLNFESCLYYQAELGVKIHYFDFGGKHKQITYHFKTK